MFIYRTFIFYFCNISLDMYHINIIKVFRRGSVIIIYDVVYVRSKFIQCNNNFLASSPTNPTPPDSLTSDDSSYMSARDSSATSMSTARVRFSPVTLLDLPTQGQHQDSTVPLQASSPSSRRSSSVSEFIA